MNPWKTATMALVVSASLGLAEDFKTSDGKIYKDATITHVEADGIVIRTKTGISKIYFVELPKDVQERFHHGSVTPTGKAVTQRIDQAESAKQGTTFVDGTSLADKFAQRVEKKLEERESILQGKNTPGPAELAVRQEMKFHWAYLAVIAITAIVLFVIVWRRFK